MLIHFPKIGQPDLAVDRSAAGINLSKRSGGSWNVPSWASIRLCWINLLYWGRSSCPRNSLSFNNYRIISVSWLVQVHTPWPDRETNQTQATSRRSHYESMKNITFYTWRNTLMFVVCNANEAFVEFIAPTDACLTVISYETTGCSRDPDFDINCGRRGWAKWIPHGRVHNAIVWILYPNSSVLKPRNPKTCVI